MGTVTEAPHRLCSGRLRHRRVLRRGRGRRRRSAARVRGPLRPPAGHDPRGAGPPRRHERRHHAQAGRHLHAQRRPRGRGRRGPRAHAAHGRAAPGHRRGGLAGPGGRAHPAGARPSTPSSRTSTSASGPRCGTGSCRWWLVESSDGFVREADRRARCPVRAAWSPASTWCGTSRARSGCWRTTCATPAAISYVLENREP